MQKTGVRSSLVHHQNVPASDLERFARTKSHAAVFPRPGVVLPYRKSVACERIVCGEEYSLSWGGGFKVSNKLLLVDYENVQQVDFDRLDDGFQVIVFVGASQKSVPIDMVASTQKLGNRVEWCRVEGNGCNALDFYIAFQLGRVIETTPGMHCIVLSKDKGFDPLLRHLDRSGLKCRRINSLLELDPKSASTEEPNYKRVFELLSKTNKQKRRRKRTTLSQHISAMFQKKISQPDVDRIIDILFANKMISESNNVITYEF